jgi:GT2 family glycosyltransferase
MTSQNDHAADNGMTVIDTTVRNQAERGFVSVVVVCPGQLEYTRLCAQSVLRHSRRPCELVFVDVASLDGTREFLEGLAVAASLPVKVVGIDQDHDLATAYGVGVSRCEGQYVVLLNNDAIVTDRWLDQLTGLADVDPQIGLVGAMSNHAPPPQYTGPVPYRFGSRNRPQRMEDASVDDSVVLLDAIDNFARRWREEHSKQWFEADRLASFCVLIKRSVLEQIGPVFAPAPLGISDEDLSDRVRRAGYRLACCRDLFVHHFGSRIATLVPQITIDGT